MVSRMAFLSLFCHSDGRVRGAFRSRSVSDRRRKESHGILSERQITQK